MAVTSHLLTGLCSLLMAALFAGSASFQLNDPDWYFWFPLYVIACVVNFIMGFTENRSTRKMAKFAFWLGLFLFTKVSIEELVHGKAGLWSLDMRERLVRERFGSGLVMSSMFLHLGTLSRAEPHTRRHKIEVTEYIQYGMPILVTISYGLSFAFFLFHHKEMKF